MRHDFDQRVNRRNTASYKWDQSEKLFGDPEILPLWVADMDFKAPQAVVEAISKRAAEGIYGYTIKPQSYYDAIIGWVRRRHQWEIQQDWLSSSPGIVPALSIIVQAFTEPGDHIILQSPVYYPFYDVIRSNGREVVNNELLLQDGQYQMDFETLERQLAPETTKLLLLCSPHNPGGRVWEREELVRLGELCLKYNVLVVSDEIHFDLVFRGSKHLPFASLSAAFEQNSITCIATSKTFNLAGLQTATIILPNEKHRRIYNQALKTLSLHLENYFGVTAVESAYNHGEQWLDDLLMYLEENLDYLLRFAEQKLQPIQVIKPQGTYLVWMDCRQLGLDPSELKTLMFQEAKVAFSEGSVFGRNGEGFLRINIACPRTILIEALVRFEAALDRRKLLQSN